MSDFSFPPSPPNVTPFPLFPNRFVSSVNDFPPPPYDQLPYATLHDLSWMEFVNFSPQSSPSPLPDNDGYSTSPLSENASDDGHDFDPTPTDPILVRPQTYAQPQPAALLQYLMQAVQDPIETRPAVRPPQRRARQRQLPPQKPPTGGWKIRCPEPECSTLVFSKQSRLKQHTRTHTGEKPYGCGHCPKRFSHPFNRNRHESKTCPQRNDQTASEAGASDTTQ